MSISRYFNKAKPSEVFISVANEEKEKTVKSMDLTRNEVTSCIMCVQYIGGCSVHRGVFSTLGDIMMHVGAR